MAYETMASLTDIARTTMWTFDFINDAAQGYLDSRLN